MNYITIMRLKDDNDMTVFARRLRGLRHSRRLRQEDLAKALGVSRDKIAYYENRSRNPTVDFVMKVAEHFGVTTDELLREDDVRRVRPGPVSKLERQLDMIRQLPTKQQEAVSTVLDMALNTATPLSCPPG